MTRTFSRPSSARGRAPRHRTPTETITATTKMIAANASISPNDNAAATSATGIASAASAIAANRVPSGN
jgi:hypothetical protein